MTVKQIYLLATNTKKPVSGIITGVTGEAYNHASIAFDASLLECYSFSMGRRGFVRETPSEWPAWTIFEMRSVDVSRSGFEAARSYAWEMSRSGKTFSYAKLAGIVLNRAHQDEEAMFCSEFVERACLAAGLPPTASTPELTTPLGVVARPDSRVVASGLLHQHIIAHFKSRPVLVAEGLDIDFFM